MVFEFTGKATFCHKNVAISVDVGVFSKGLECGKVAFFHFLRTVFEGAHKGGFVFTCNDKRDVKGAIPKGAHAHGFREAFKEEQLGELLKGALGKFAFLLGETLGKFCIIPLGNAFKQGGDKGKPKPKKRQGKAQAFLVWVFKTRFGAQKSRLTHGFYSTNALNRTHISPFKGGATIALGDAREDFVVQRIASCKMGDERMELFVRG